MKKFICLIAMMLVCIPVVFAALGDGKAYGPLSDNPEASTKVTLDLTTTGDSYVELWFEGGEEDSTSFSNPKTGVNLSFEDGSVIASNSANGSDDELYACWRIVSANNITVQLALKDKLATDGSQNKIDWNVTWADSGKIDSKELTAEENAEVAADLPAGTRTGLQTNGETQLTISTNASTDFSQLTAGSYSAYLYLRCKTN